MKKYPNLFSPLKLGNLTLKNRIIAAPTGARYITDEGHFTRDTTAIYELKAAGGAAAVTLGQSFVHAKTGKSSVVAVNLDDPMVLPSLARAAKAIKRHGAIPSIQLQHAGKSGGFGSPGEVRIRYGPSHEITEDGAEILEMPEELILEIVEAYG